MGASGLRESTGSALSFSLVRFKLLGLSSWNIGSAWAVDRCKTLAVEHRTISTITHEMAHKR